MRRTSYLLVALLVITSLLLAACGGGAAPAATNTPAPAKPAEATNTPVPAKPAEKVQIRWFVGLGTGSNPDQIEKENLVVEKFNKSQDKITLVAEYVENSQAPDQLKTQIAAGNPPDIVGPVGQSGVNDLTGQFLDLESYLKDFDWSAFDKGSVNAYRLDEGTFGIPFAVFPSFLFYNRDLFDEAGLDYPPHKYGEKYADGDAWTMDKMKELAMLLTLDENGNNANSPDFNPEKIVQFGYHTQWTDPRGQATLWGNGNVIDAKTGKATLSDNWRKGFKWFYDGMHKDHFMPSSTYQASDLLAAGNPFDSGNVAMAHTHLWYTCCNTNVKNWDIAAIPSYDGKNVVSKLHADTFRILKATKHPEEAVQVLLWLTDDGAPELLQIYGGLPGRLAMQADFFKGMDEKFPQKVDWQVAIDSLAYPDIPNHESNLPNYAKAYDRIGAFQTLYESDPKLDIDAELDKLVSDLQVIFDEAK